MHQAQTTIKLGKSSGLIYNSLKKHIESGKFRKGEKLPTEYELCDMYKASRSAVRRAVAALSEHGLLQSRQGDGIYVKRNKVIEKKTPVSRTVSIMSQFNSDLLMQIQEYLLEKQFLLCPFQQIANAWDPAIERSFLNRVLAERHHSLLAFCTPIEPQNTELVTDIADSGTNVVYIGPHSLELPQEDYVMFDYKKAGYMAAVTLLISGYESLIFAGIAPDSPFQMLLEKGFKEALKDQQRENSYYYYDFPRDVWKDQERKNGVIDFVNSQKKNTAIFFVTETMAFNFYELTDQMQHSIPNELGLLSIQEAPYQTCEQIDSLEFDRLAMIKTAIDFTLNKQPKETLAMLIPPTLKKRGMLK